MQAAGCGIHRWVAPAMLVLAATAARAFVPLPAVEPVETSYRWSAIGHPSTDGKGLHDGLTVFVSPGFAAALVEATLGTATAEDVADTEDAIRAAFAAWESPVLAFDVAFEAPAVRGLTVGAEIDLFIAPPDDPVFPPDAQFAITYVAASFEPLRLLTNQDTLAGFASRGADIVFKTDLIPVFAPLFPTREDKLHALQRLVMHEVGHALGLHHPNGFPQFNLDTNTDPLDRMAIDPTAPLAGLLVGTPIDVDAVMSDFPTSIPGALVLTALRNDDRGGRDVLYPAPVTVVCPPIPRTHCRAAARGALAIKAVAGVPAKTRLAWAWSKGAATTLEELGDPLATRISGLCVYSGAPARLLALRVPPDPLLWKAKGTAGFAYADRTGSADGARKVVLKSGAPGKAAAAFAAGGTTMPVPALGALPAPITVQLVDRESAVCLESVFAAADLKANTATKLKAKRKPS